VHIPKNCAEHAPADFPKEGGVGTPGAKVHFTVMHVVNPKDEERDGVHDAEKPKTSADSGVFELMHHADSMLNRDNQQLDQV